VKDYKAFFKEYKTKLCTQYPSLDSLNLEKVPVSPFVVNISEQLFKQIKDTVQLFYRLSHLKAYSQSIQTEKPEYLNTSPSSVLMSYDFHIDSHHGLKLIEINTHSSGYLVSEVVDQVHGIKGLDSCGSCSETVVVDKIHGIKVLGSNALISLKRSFELEWQGFSNSNKPPLELLIVDEAIKDQKMYIEFLMYRDFFKKMGWSARLSEIKDLKLNGEGLLVDSDQKKIQMIYNRCTDFYFDHWPVLKKAFLDQVSCISPHPGEYLLLADKRRFCELSSDDFLEKVGLSPEEKHQIKKVIPFTAVSSFFSLEDLWLRRKKLFFKPMRGYGGKSVYRGKSISKVVFNRLIKEEALCQELVPPPVFTDPFGVKWKYDIRAYVYRDQVQKLAARVYQGQLTQFRVPLSGFATVCVQ